MGQAEPSLVRKVLAVVEGLRRLFEGLEERFRTRERSAWDVEPERHFAAVVTKGIGLAFAEAQVF